MALEASDDGWPIVEYQMKIDAFVVFLYYLPSRGRFRSSYNTIHMQKHKPHPHVVRPHLILLEVSPTSEPLMLS